MHKNPNRLIQLENELTALRQRIEFLENQLSLNRGQFSFMERTVKQEICVFCQGAHPVRTCEYYRYLQLDDRWSVARKLGLCFRCLDNNDRHLGKDCPKARICRIKGCRLLHDRLLHDPDRRKLKAERYRATIPLEPISFRSDCNAENLTDSVCSEDIELGATPAPSKNDSEVGETHFLDNLNSFIDADGLDSFGDIESPHAGATTACDGENDPQMDELNRLVMVAEMNVPFDMIFSGSSRKKLHQVVIPKPSDGGATGHVNKTDSLNLIGDTAAPCDGEADSIERSEDGPVFKAPSGGEIEIPCGGSIDSKADKVDLMRSHGQDCEKCPSQDHVPSTESLNGNSSGPFEDSDGYLWLTNRMEKSGMFFNRHNESYTGTDSSEPQKSSHESNRGRSDGNIDVYSQENGLSKVSSDESEIAAHSSGQFTGEFNCILPAENNENTESRFPSSMQLKDLFQTCSTSKSTLLLTLEDQLRRIDDEIAYLSTPAKQFENRTEIDLSVWLMPDPGGSQKC